MHRGGKPKSKPKKPNSFEKSLLCNQARVDSRVSKKLDDALEKGGAIKFKIKDMPVRKPKNRLAYTAPAVSATRPFPRGVQGSQTAGRLPSNAASAKQP